MEEDTGIGRMGLIRMFKDVKGTKTVFKEPQQGKKQIVELLSPENVRIQFSLSVNMCKRRSVSMSMERPRKANVAHLAGSDMLVRLDYGDEDLRHVNPDGTVVQGSHVHVFAEEYGMGYAFPIGEKCRVEDFRLCQDELPVLFEAFTRFCNITDRLKFEWTLGL